MRLKKYRYFSCDFETTVYDGQERTEVWASGCVELFTDDVTIFHSISEQLDYLVSLKTNVVAYFHNLKFDGSFWLDYLLIHKKLKQAYQVISDDPLTVKWMKEKDMPYNSFKYSISDRGQWYTIVLNINGNIIEIRDSLKLLPFSVATIGQSFGTKHKKLEMDYKGFRYAGCPITPEEEEYIKNDVLVVKEALEIMFSDGHDSLTIGACCLKEFKGLYLKEEYNNFFPNIYELPLDKSRYAVNNVGEYVRKSYRGGWCYLVKSKEAKIFHGGSTFDVCSLYPSMMSSESGNYYPVGKPMFWTGDQIPDEALDNKYYFVRVRTRFYIKHNMLPFIQLKGNLMYRGTECLNSTDIYDPQTDSYHTHYTQGGKVMSTRVTMTLTMTDYKLLKDHYNLVEFEILDGCYFYQEIGLFDEYIEKYKKQKQESVGALREEAKLFLNNLYGKMASSDDSSFKVAYVKDNNTIGFTAVSEHSKKPGYIPVGSAITSYSRDFTIRAAQKNYHGPDKPGFIYADTDSIHCDLPPEQIVGIKIDDKKFCYWKPESNWDEAIFTRQKTYIEHITHENLKPVEPHYDIKCAGMPKKCKKLFEMSMSDYVHVEGEYDSEVEQDFLSMKRTLEDFNIGLDVPGKLMPKRVSGGILLIEGNYKMR